MSKSTEKSDSVDLMPPVPKGAVLEKYTNNRGGFGYLVVGGIATSGTGIRPRVAPGYCPKCETPAEPWEPPVGFARYDQRIKTLRAGYGLASDELAHAHYLKATGGYIHICSQCENSFFVPASVAKIKTGE